MTKLDYVRGRYQGFPSEAREDVGVRFRKYKGDWVLSIPNKVNWVVKEGYTIPVTKRNGAILNVRLKAKVGDNQYGELWSFKKYGEGAVSPISGP